MSRRVDAARIGSWLAAGLVAAGAITALIALTVEGEGLPRGSGGAWATATFFAAADGERTVTVEMTARGAVAAVEGSQEEITALDGLQILAGHPDDRGGAEEPFGRAVPQSMAILAIWLAVGLLVGAGVVALAPRYRRALWPLVGSAALALLVTGVLLRQLTVGALGSWLAQLDAARFDVAATRLSGLPVVGAVLALAGAVVGSIVGTASTKSAGSTADADSD